MSVMTSATSTLTGELLMQFVGSLHAYTPFVIGCNLAMRHTASDSVQGQVIKSMKRFPHVAIRSCPKHVEGKQDGTTQTLDTSKRLHCLQHTELSLPKGKLKPNLALFQKGSGIARMDSGVVSFLEILVSIASRCYLGIALT